MKIVVLGSNGRMGQRIQYLIKQDKELSLKACIDKENFADLESLSLGADLMIDFSSPSALIKNLEVCKKNKIKLVLGTTGISEEGLEALNEASKSEVIFYASNYSIGVSVIMDLINRASKVLGSDFDIDILESHHRFKVDHPSGTALSLAGALDSERVRFSSMRRGGVVGVHEVIFTSLDEEVFIGHRAFSRDVFASGAIRAAKWLYKKDKPGLYNMSDLQSS